MPICCFAFAGGEPCGKKCYEMLTVIHEQGLTVQAGVVVRKFSSCWNGPRFALGVQALSASIGYM
jgi:hypothetical protein